MKIGSELIALGSDGATTTYGYDYANRLISLSTGGASTTYGYDAFGARVFQIIPTTSTTTYPFKTFAVSSSTNSSNNFSTSTEFIFGGETLLSTIDQPFKNGAATGTAATRYIHPDHLGSTDVVTDANQNLVETLSYYPYGAPRISNSTSTNEKRQYISQFSDDSGLSYFQNRYYDLSRGQFLTTDPSVLAVGNPAQVKQLTGQDQQTFLSDPQQMNSTSYSRDNPITRKDPSGLDSYYNNAGQMVFSDSRTNGNFYQANDAAMLSSNLRLVTSGKPASNFSTWFNSVKTGGTWDYKGPASRGGREYYFFNGQLMDANAFGNANYGYTGAAIGIGPNILVDAAGTVGALNSGPGGTNNGINPWNIEGNFNSRGNVQNILTGVNTFNSSQFSNTLSRTSQAVSSAGYNAASAPILARLATALIGAVQTLRNIAAGK